MAITLINPTFSFVQFGAVDPHDYSLPVTEDNDLAFQVVIETDTEANADNLMGSDIFISLFAPAAIVANITDFNSLALISFDADDLQVIPFRIDATKVLLYWPHGIPGFKDVVAIDSCFKLILLVFDNDSDHPVFYTSNQFHRTDSEYTSLIKYSCDENAFAFNYCADETIENRIRVYMHLRRPQMPEESAIHKRSNGVRKVLKFSISKEYETITELFNMPLHESLNMALSHDYVYVKGKYYEGNVVKNGNYEVDWPDFNDYHLAAGKVKLIASPYNWRNSNCAECDTCRIVNVEGVILLPDVVVDTAYSYSFNLDGTAPFLLEIISKPAWMTIAIVGNQVQFSGTPTVVGGDIDVQIKISNCWHGGLYELNDTIDVNAVPPECIPLSRETLPEFPDAIIDEDYLFIISFDGSTPFTLSDIVKPSWMTITVSTNTVRCEGTPTTGDEGTDIEVSFKVHNCDELIYDVSDLINVFEEATLNWEFTESGADGTLDITVNAISVLHQTASGSGTITFHVGDTVDVEMLGGTGTTNFLDVSLTGTGSLYSYAGSSNGDYSFTAVAGIYEVSAGVGE